MAQGNDRPRHLSLFSYPTFTAESERPVNPAIALRLAKKRNVGLMKTSDDLSLASSQNAVGHISTGNGDGLVKHSINSL